MDAVLLTITVAALGLAIGLAVVGWKLLRRGRDDMAARVDALRALAASPDPDALDPLAARPAPAIAIPVFARLSTLSADTEETTDWDATLGSTLQPQSAWDRHIFSASTVAPTPNRRFWAVAAVAGAVLASAGTVYAVYRPQPAPPPRHEGDNLVPAGTVPLALLSLTESADADGTFTVTGLIANPSDGQTALGVVAVVYLFDRDGHYFATGRAGIDLGSLAPGDESPFVVRVPHGAAAARYRVGFRKPDGAVVAHIDKRGQPITGTTEVGAAPGGTRN
jgi:hypothetical protein